MSSLRTSKAQNLARIRDNQRRSRARRKEYLHELEDRLRNYEQAGVEASAEIQGAARKVLEENKKLRALLRDRDVSETEINAIVGGGQLDKSYDPSTTSLDALLERRAGCRVLPSAMSQSPSYTRASSMPRHLPSVPPITIPAPRSTMSYGDSPSPGSIASSMGSPPSMSYSAPHLTSHAPPIKSEDVHYNYLHENSYQNPWSYSNTYGLAPDTGFYTSSCVDAANIMSTMRSDPRMGYETDETDSEIRYSYPTSQVNAIPFYMGNSSTI